MPTYTTNYHNVNGQMIAERTTGRVNHDYLTDALGSVTATMNPSYQVTNLSQRYAGYGSAAYVNSAYFVPDYGFVGGLGYRRTGRYQTDSYLRERNLSFRTLRFTSSVTALLPLVTLSTLIGEG